MLFRSNISSYNIQQINPPNTCSTLQAGASICIDSPQNNCSATYVVDGSEGCFDIAQDHNIPLDELYSLNPNVDSVDCTNIYFGEVLCVAPRASSGASPTTSVPASSRSASATVSSTSELSRHIVRAFVLTSSKVRPLPLPRRPAPSSAPFRLATTATSLPLGTTSRSTTCRRSTRRTHARTSSPARPSASTLL